VAHLCICVLYGLNHNESFVTTRIAEENFAKHYPIHRIFNSIGVFFISCFFYKYEEMSSRSELIYENNNKAKNSNKNILIFNDKEIGNEDLPVKSILFYFFIIFCWAAVDDVIEYYIVIFKDLDFWMFELIIIWILSIKMFNYEIYKHQILGISLCLFSGLLKIGCIIVTFIDIPGVNANDEAQYNGGLPIFYKKRPGIRITIGIALYILLITLRSYISLKLKWYMDKKYISHNKILMTYGFFGIIIYTIISIVGTFFKCPNIKDDLNMFKYLCKVNNTDNTSIHLEHFGRYASNYNNDILIILLEAFVIIIGIVSFFSKNYFSIIIIKYLTPVHLIISIPIVFFGQKVIMTTYSFIYIRTENDKQFKFFHGNIKKIIKFILDSCGDCLCILGFLIYLEICVIKFCKCDDNTKKNIMKRSFVETARINEEEDENIILDEDSRKESVVNTIELNN
jgi:hypothetical protein